MAENSILYPVILAVPECARRLQPAERNRFLSGHARRALQISAKKSGLRVDRLEKDRRGCPRPFRGVHWSLTHKEFFVGAVAADRGVGIDIEKIEPRRTGRLFQKVADADEWALAGEPDWKLFHRYWTAKEAVLKAAGSGLTELSDCRVIEVMGEGRMALKHRGEVRQVAHFYFEDHIAAITRCKTEIDWILLYGQPGD